MNKQIEQVKVITVQKNSQNYLCRNRYSKFSTKRKLTKDHTFKISNKTPQLSVLLVLKFICFWNIKIVSDLKF